MKENRNISAPRKGMNRDASPFNLGESEYSFALNTMFESESGDSYNPKNELSNELAATLPSGYKVVGLKRDIKGDRTIYWLTNPDTNGSEIGFVKNGGSYTKLVSSEDLNFDITKPIKKIVLKYEKLGTTAYWADNKNPDRYISLTDTEDFFTDGKLDVDKMRIDRKHKIPTITPVSIEAGGQLESGVYEVSLTYCDKLGNEIAEYVSVTNPIHIFDKNSRTLDNTELNRVTNQAIKVRVENLDTQHQYYKVVVVQKLLDSVSYFVEGIYPINNKDVIISTVSGKERTDINKLLSTKTTWVKSEGITSSNGYLFRFGLTAEKEINLQPISNLLGAFVKWQTVEAKESLYERGESSSLYKGYYRDEVYPFSWRFKTTAGYVSALYPLVARPATSYIDGLGNLIDEKSTVDNPDTISVTELNPECSTEERNKYWQFYNTAHGVEYFQDFTGETTTVSKPVSKFCISSNFNTITNKTLYLDIAELDKFTNLRDYIEEYGTDLVSRVPQNKLSEFDNQEVQEMLLEELEGVNCTPHYDKETCTTPVLQKEETKVTLGEVTGESVKHNYKAKEEYQLSRINSPSQIHEMDLEGKGKRDEEYMAEFGVGAPHPFVRRVTHNTERCSHAIELPQKTGSTDKSLGYVPQYRGALNMSELQTDVTTDPYDGGFTNKVHKEAIWFKSKIKEGDTAYLEIPKWIKADFADTFSREVLGNRKMRVSVFTGSSSNPKLVKTYLVDVDKGALLFDDPIKVSEIEDNEIFVALDFPIVSSSQVWFGVPHYLISVPNGIVGLEVRAQEAESVEVSFERLTTDKQQKYDMNCIYKVPVFDHCEPQPHKNGKFAYWESIEKYPDNKELYDSSWLEIEESDISEEIKKDFEKYFVASKVNGKYLLKKSTDLTNKPIRHFKFPDFNVAPFMSTFEVAPFTETLVYPLGVTVSREAINSFLDIAVKNNLLSKEQRDSIESVEIFRGDRRINKSILGKGIAFDMYKYEEDYSGDEVLFPNFPYNDLGSNNLVYNGDNPKNSIKHPYSGKSNNKFTFHSPEYDYYDINVGSEVKLEAFQYGSSRGNFLNVDKHPEWVILGKRAFVVSTVLAVLEYTLEAAIRFAQNMIESSKNYWFQLGVLQVGGNPIGASVATATTIALSAFDVLTNSVPTVGRYRYQWLQTFRDFGKPENFAFQYSSEGFYNYATPNLSLKSEGNTLRGISTGKKIKEGRFTFTDRNGEQVKVNNVDRERSVLLSLGEDHPISYPPEYLYFDNNNSDKYSSSRFTQSETGTCSKGRSEEIQRNIASPYMTLKNYVPFQYGSVGSISWLPTSGTINLKDDEPEMIFGGDIFISRYTLKRKTRLFTDDAFGLADMLPYEYSKNSNIGKTKFYCDYELGSENSVGDILFPDFESAYNFDCMGSDKGTYIKAPSKFYLYYYGIPNFLVESELNLNLRYGKKNYKDTFHPEAGDFLEWTQEKNVSIKEPNSLFYNPIYSSTTTSGAYRTLPDHFSQEEFDTIGDSPNGVIYSLQDNSENDLSDPWLVYRPLDKHQFPTSYGKLVDLEGIQSAQILGRFENTSVLFNAVNQYKDAQDAVSRELGTGGIFAARPMEFSSTELGYTGTGSYQMVSNEYGSFYADADRGQVFQFNSKMPKEISSHNGNASTGMKAWFKEHLPFKIKSPVVNNYENIDTDNALNGIGITMGWDAKYDRVFLTKIDYEPIKEMSYYDGKFMIEDCNSISYCKFTDKEQTIQDKLDQGYKFIEEGCSLIFQKFTEGCEYETTVYDYLQADQTELINQGYTLVGQVGKDLHFERVTNVCDDNSKQAEIQALLDQGYVKDSQTDCDIIFVKDVCDYTNQQSQIDDLIAQGYTLKSEVGCSRVYEKVDTPDDNVANDDYVMVDEGESTTFNVIANDVSGSSQNLVIGSFTQPTNGTVTQVNTTSFKYTHNGSKTTSDSFTYVAENDAGQSNTATVYISIDPFVFDIDPVSVGLLPRTSGTTNIEVYSNKPWTASMEYLDWQEGTIEISPTSGSAGTTNIVATYTAAKGTVKVHITSNGVTKTSLIIID
jgi:hypothetical protein